MSCDCVTPYRLWIADLKPVSNRRYDSGVHPLVAQNLTYTS